MPLPWSKIPVENDEARRSERLDIFLPVVVRVSQEEAFGFLLDLSGTGAKIGAIAVPRVGDPVVVEWEGEGLPGRCAWATSCRYGVAFDRPIVGHRLVSMLAR